MGARLHGEVGRFGTNGPGAERHPTTLNPTQIIHENTMVRKADPVQMRSVLDAFRDRHGADWRCQWDQETGLARYLRKGRTQVPGAGASPAAAAAVFLASSRDILGLAHVGSLGWLVFPAIPRGPSWPEAC